MQCADVPGVFLHLDLSLSYILRDKNTNTNRKENVKVCCGLIDQPIAAYNFHLSLAKANTTYLDTFFPFFADLPFDGKAYIADAQGLFLHKSLHMRPEAIFS